MGKGVITSNSGCGWYMVREIRDTSRAEAQLADVEGRITTTESELSTWQTRKADADQDVADALDTLNTAIQSGSGVQDAHDTWTEAAAQAGRINASITALESELAGLERERDRLSAVINDQPPDRFGHCIDGYDALQPGEEVGIIDYARNSAERMGAAWRSRVLIQPGHTRDPHWAASRDGIIQPAGAGTPASTTLNLAMHPGARVWRPRYWTATITRVFRDTDTCDLILDGLHDPVSGHNNDMPMQKSQWFNVPVEYGGCNSKIFAYGDFVVVEFSENQNKESGAICKPTVIGFVGAPYACQNVSDIFTLEIRAHPSDGEFQECNYYDRFYGWTIDCYTPDFFITLDYISAESLFGDGRYLRGPFYPVTVKSASVYGTVIGFGYSVDAQRYDGDCADVTPMTKSDLFVFDLANTFPGWPIIDTGSERLLVYEDQITAYVYSSSGGIHVDLPTTIVGGYSC